MSASEDYSEDYSDDDYSDENSDDAPATGRTSFQTTDDDLPDFNDSRYTADTAEPTENQPNQHRGGIRGRQKQPNAQDTEESMHRSFATEQHNVKTTEEDDYDYDYDDDYEGEEEEEEEEADADQYEGEDNDDEYEKEYENEYEKESNIHKTSLPTLPTLLHTTTTLHTTNKKTSPMRSSTSHPILTTATEQRKHIQQYGKYMDSKRPWVQRRAAQVHHQPSVFALNSRPRIPTAILSVNGNAWQRKTLKRKNKKRRRQHDQYDEWGSSGGGGSKNGQSSTSPNRIVPGGKHFSMLGTTTIKNDWESSLPTLHNNKTNNTAHNMPSLNALNAQDTAALSAFLFSKLNTITTVYKLRAKDLFASIDRNSDGIIDTFDMYESLQVLGVVDVLPREATQLIHYIVRQSGNKELDFHAFEFAMRRTNHRREKSLTRRMGHYVGAQNALSNKILHSQSTAVPLLASGSTELDATKSIKDVQGKIFWKDTFSCHTTSVGTNRFMKELKLYFMRHSVHRQPFPDNDFVFRRIRTFVTSSNPTKVSALSFGQLLNTFGPMNRLKSNVMAGPLLSNHNKKVLRHKKITTKSNLRMSRGKTKIRHY